MLSTLYGVAIFAKLDIAETYLQLTVDDESDQLLTLNTTRDLMKVKRVPFGVSCALFVFQRDMEQLLGGLEKILI